MRFVRSVNPNTPHGNSVLWRYLSLDRFLDILDSKSLYFPRATEFSDKYEFSLPARTAQEIKNEGGEESLHKAIADVEAFRESTFVSCWTKRPHESYVLWKIYVRDSRYGVAIKTTMSKLRRDLERENSDQDISTYHVEVQYDDFISPEQLDTNKIASTKRTFYKGEDEVRLYFSKFSDENTPLRRAGLPKGIPLRIMPSLMIDEVYLSPFGGNKFNAAFKEMLGQRYSWIQSKIKLSEILDR